MRSSSLLALAAALSAASAQYTGFNYGSTGSDGYSVRTQAQFQQLFATAKGLVGTNGGFTSARLYTMIQAGTTADPTGAIPAAIAEGTHLLLGLWASGPIDNEIAALKTAIAKYGSAFTSLVAGISVGSEDLYRNSPMGIAAGSTVGAEPSTIVDYIGQVRALISGTGLSGVPVGHVDTWTGWVNGSNQAVVNACDFIGVDAYPYFQDTMSNGIGSAAGLFQDALTATQNAVGSKDIWITETGWPVSGKTRNLAVADTTNAKAYWDQVGCPRFGKTNVFWYTLEDTDNGASPNPSFGVTTGTSTTPLFDLSCSGVSSSSSSSASSTATSSHGSGAVSTGTGSSGSSVTSAASSVSTAASVGGIASSGEGLSPSKGPGSGNGGSGSNATATATGSSGSGSGSGSSGNATGLSTTSKPTGTSSSTGSSTSAATVSTNAATVLSGSVMGMIGAVFAALAVL